MDRATLQHSLAALAAELDTLDRQGRWLGLKAASARSAASEDEGYSDPDSRASTAAHRSAAIDLDRRRETLASIRTRLGAVGTALAQDDAAWKAERRTYDAIMGQALTVGRQFEEAAPAAVPEAPPAVPNVPAPEPLPFLSACVDDYLADLLKDGKRADYANGLAAKCREFAALVGDRPITEYVPRDLKTFAKHLADLPTNWTKLREFRDSTSPEIVAKVAALREAGKPVPTCQSETTIATYVAAVTGAFRWIAVEHNIRTPFADLRVSAPGHAPKAIVREPFSVEALNHWFACAAKEARPDDYWLPLLGTLTGARIGELAYLQGGDIVEMRPGLWVADLTRYLTVNGKRVERQVKNEGSRRYFALHQELIDVGFIAYAKGLRPSEWVFPHLHHEVQDPADAASKRHGRHLRAYGLHSRLSAVFHSSRHTAKDILRIAKVDSRTSSLQTGHAFKSVEETYGSKRLRVDEVEVLAALTLPEGLDLAPYRKSRGPVQRRVLKRRVVPA
ncbi:hypothetical protein [Aureimonas endophytica]|uniref:hypothetical protein n=1 Tax=Aureimonas endophytica TaxID=2027858 RepID=UPI0016642315|nr:hypothetical protein [Aureimonas endophytica]